MTRARVRPDDEELPFTARWNVLIRALLVESSVKLVARTAGDYANLYDRDDDRLAGGNTYPGNERLARETGLSERTVRTAWAVIRDLGMAERTKVAAYDPVKKKWNADEYQLVIPDGWEGLPILGPNSGKFHCLHCECLFTPQANCKVNAEGRVTFEVPRFCFCPPPKDKSKGPGCFKLWSLERRRAELQPWGELDVWKLFRESRGEEW
jgi:hypothetical protein